MKLDVREMSAAVRGAIWIMPAEGKHLGEAAADPRVTNVAFGDNDGKMLYITTDTGNLIETVSALKGYGPVA